VLVDRCLIRGGLASESAVEILVQSTLERLGIGGRQAYRWLDPVEQDVQRIFTNPAVPRTAVGARSE